MEVDKHEEEDAFKFDDEDPRPEDRSAGEEEESERAKGMTAPVKVSDKERAEHELTHTKFRAWCPYCVRARGRSTSHLKNQGINKDKSNEVQRMGMDYFFTSQEDEKASANPIKVMVDERTGEKYARAVGHKGVGKDQDTEWLIKDMSNELKVWGHLGGTAGNIILMSDGEPAFLAV